MHDLKVVYGDAVEEEYEENWLAFLETGYNYKREPHGILNLKPIDVGPLMSGLILDKVPATIMMSATMKINGSFSFMKRELGLPSNAVEFVGESPFDFSTQVVGYFPTHLPSPDKDEYLEAVIDEAVSIIEYMNGRTMMLFTNMGHMRQVCDAVRERVSYTCYVQGQAQKNTLINLFSNDTHSCLFATRSFFTGVDIPGETLSCVILVKAPFRVPTEPMFKAKCDLLDSNGINSFSSYSMPLMLFDVRQAFGRLIRSITDNGLFVLLDSRALKKSYGGNILRSLPRLDKISGIGEAPIKSKPLLDLAALELDD
jgi:ATP-dependent DNA helicase DinG